jgi:di/tricarboxylate transporter
MPGLARDVEVRAGDMLVVEGDPESIEDAVGGLGLEYMRTGEGVLAKEDLALAEVVVPESSRLAGRTPMSLRLLYRYRVAIVGVSRRGKRFREHVRKLETKAGDVLLLLGAEDRLADVISRLGLLPLADRGQRVIQRDKAWWAVLIFAAAIIAASVGIVYLPIALGCVAGAYVFLNIVSVRSLYDSVEWP